MKEKEVIDFIKANIRYDKEAGKLFWLTKSGNKLRNEKEILNIDSAGYRRLSIGTKSYKLHRVVWLLETGAWPSGQIDHINGIKDDNRFSNLRDVDHRANVSNFSVHRSGKVVGVSRDHKKNLYRARISVNKKSVMLGRYKDIGSAKAAYETALTIVTNGVGKCQSLVLQEVLALRQSMKESKLTKTAKTSK